MMSSSKVESQLLKASLYNQLETLTNILNNKELQINVNCCDENNYMSSPFTMACRKGHLDVVKALAGDKRVELNFRNKYGMTGFYRAREKGNERVVEYLLTLKGIDVNRADECEGWTPLIAASFNGHVGVVQHLLANCERLTDVRYKDFEGFTALDNAKKGGESKLRKENCSKVVTLLTSFEANQKQIRNDLRKQLGYLDKDAAQLFTLIILTSDEYLQFLNQ